MLKNWKIFLLHYFAGVALALAFPSNLALPSITALLAPLAIFIWLYNLPIWKTHSRNLKTSLLSHLCFSLGFYGAGYYWIPQTIAEFGGIEPPLNFLLGMGYALVALPHFTSVILVAYALKMRKIKIPLILRRPPILILNYAFILTLAEQTIPQLFPSHLGHIWGQFAPYIGLAPIFGSVAFSFVTYYILIAIYALKESQINLSQFLLPFFIFCLFLSLNIFLKLEKKDGHKNFNIRMVQANIPNNIKVFSENNTTEEIEEVLQTFQDLSLSGETSHLDLIIWPETSFPTALNLDRLKNIKQIPEIFQIITHQTNAELIVGGYTINPDAHPYYFESDYNSIFHFKRNLLKDTYHKIKLLPFGEGLPFGPLNRPLSQFLRNISYFASGKESTLFKGKKKAKFNAVICYEILFSSFIRTSLNSLPDHPDFMINLTNDSWYGDTAEPYQHQFLAKWRAFEFQIPLVRSTNTGITSILWPNGENSKSLPLFRKGYLDLSLPLGVTKPTIYQKYGQSLTFLFWIGILLLLCFHERRSLLK